MSRMRYALAAVVLATTASFADAEVVRIELGTRSEVLAGKVFGNTGAYEGIVFARSR
jgi:hypothetical protein